MEMNLKNFNTLCDEDKKQTLEWLYNDMNLSWTAIAEKLNTYTNKIRREAIKLGIGSKSRSEGQKNALAKGRHKHPTKDTKRAEETKVAISEAMANSWENISDAERKQRSLVAQKQWADMSPQEKLELQRKAHTAVQLAAKSGSKLEKWLHNKLIKHGHVVDFHKEHLILNERLHIDLLLPKLRVAVEIDGPSHFKPIWGGKTLERNKKSDAEKDGLLIAKGLVVIRIKQSNALSEKFKRDILNQLLDTLQQIKLEFPSKGKRKIVLGE